MADKIKSFFERRKGKGKFKGQGHRLNEPSQKPAPVAGTTGKSGRTSPTMDAKRAGEAALARFEQSAPLSSMSSSFGSRPPRVVSTSSGTSNAMKPAQPELLAVQGVFFKCPVISNEVLPKDEWKKKIETFLYEQLEVEPSLTACLMIHTLNSNKSEIDACVATLATYLSNILQNPEEEKYKKIRLANKVFQEKVGKIIGGVEFLKGVGFTVQTLPFKEDAEEEFLVYSKNPVDADELEMHLDSLRSAEKIPLELDRNLQVLNPDVAATKVDLPDDFYRLTLEDLKREQMHRKQRIESMMELRTKAMRDKEDQRELRKYKYTIIRIRFPDGVLLQGTFNVYEKARAVREFVAENLIHSSMIFDLRTPLGDVISNDLDDTLLLDLKLVPAVLLNFSGPPIEGSTGSYLSPATMMLLQSSQNP